MLHAYGMAESKIIAGYDLGDGTSQTAVVVMEKNEEGKLVVREAHVGEDARKWLLVNAPQTLRD